MNGNTFVLVCGVWCFILQVLAAADNQQLFILGDVTSGSGLAAVTRDIVHAATEIDCARQCSNARAPSCGAFYYDAPSRRCQHVTHNYVQLESAPSSATQYSFYYMSQAIFTSSSPQKWLFCPTGTNGVYEATVTTSTLNLTFTITLGTFSHTQAWDACTDAGQTLMRIETWDKQAIVEDILNSCSDLSPYDYWLDGARDNNTDTWMYADGSALPMNTTHLWDKDAPNNGAVGQDCVRMRSAKAHRWDDFECTKQIFAYICEPI